MCEQTKVRMIRFCESLTELESKINKFCEDKMVQNIQYFSINSRHCAMITYKITIL